jgi:hypothetical protein
LISASENEDGGARMGSYPELSAYLASLGAFKKHFLKFFSQRDAYLHNMFAKAEAVGNAETAWVRVHRSGDEALVLVTDAHGAETKLDLALDMQNILGRPAKSVKVWSRTLECLTTTRETRINVHIPREDLVAIHVQ